MTAFEHCLPVEVWLNIFDQIQDKQQLAKCQLVCKMWKPLAKMAMLKSVVLTKTNTPKLYQHLLEHPRSARHIQVIDISEYPMCEESDLSEFMALAVTPSLKAIDADMCSNEFLNTLLDLVSQKPKDSLKLERLPVTTFDTDTYVALVSLLKKTLQLLVLGFTDSNIRESIKYISSNLSSFENLTDLRVVDYLMYTNSVPKLDGMLKGCHRLRTLTLEIDLLVDTRPYYQGSSFNTWLVQNVQKENCLKTIVINNSLLRSDEKQETSPSGLLHEDILRYLSFKYPKVKHLEIHNYEQRNQPIVRSLFENAGTVRLRNWMIDSIDHVQDMIDTWKSKTNSLAISYSNLEIPAEYVCRMNVVKQDNHTRFTLKDTYSYNAPEEKIRQLVASLSGTLTKDFEINLEEYEKDDSQRMKPLRFLQFTPLIERLKLEIEHLAHELPPSQLTQLHTLELRRMQLTAKDVATIAFWAPHLKHITFSFCSFIADHLGFEGLPDQDITLPRLALDTLTVKGRMPSQDLCITLIIAGSKLVQQFYAAPSKSIVRVTYGESGYHTSGTTKIYIECKSLKHLSVNLNNVTVKLEFDGKGKVIESKPDISNSIRTQLILHKTEKRAIAAKYEKAKKFLTEAQIRSIEESDV